MKPASFDAYAPDYDLSFTATEIGKLQRKVVVKRLRPLLNSATKVLEINCGTGYDARLLAPATKEYLATDISEKMIEICRNHQALSSLTNLRFEKRAIQELDTELEQCTLLYSNFGGLNCLSPEELRAFANNCSQAMRPESELFLVVMGRCCIWEQLYFCLKFRFVNAFRRLSRKGTDTLIGDSRFTTWYYSPRELKKLLAPFFTAMDQGPVGFCIPLSYLNPFFNKWPGLLRMLAGADKVFTNFSFLANFGDHYYLYLKKRP